MAETDIHLHDMCSTSDESIIALLQEWEQFANDQCVLHEEARRHFKLHNYMLAIPAIILSTVSGTGNIGLSSSECTSGILSIAFGSLALVSASLFSIHRYMNLPELQQMHEFYSDEFTKIANEIRMNIVLRNDASKTYTSIHEFTKNIKKHLDICIDKAPAVPMSIIILQEKNKGRKLMESMTLRKVDVNNALSINVLSSTPSPVE